MMAFCLFQDSPPLSEQERRYIDYNLDAVCYRGREPSLMLQRDSRQIPLREWATELCSAMTGFAELLDTGVDSRPYREALQNQVESVRDPERTPSARIVADMRADGEGYFQFARRMSLQHQKYFLNLQPDPQTQRSIGAAVEKSVRDQRHLEVSDTRSFDEFLRDYFAQKF